MALYLKEQLIEIASGRDYGRGFNHANQVRHLAATIYKEMGKLHFLDGSAEDQEILEVAALLHDVGLPDESMNSSHNEAGFDFLNRLLPGLKRVDPEAGRYMPVIMYCVLWHNDHEFPERGGVPVIDPVRTRRLAAILRIADGLDRAQSQVVADLTIRRNGTTLAFTIALRRLDDIVQIEIELRTARTLAEIGMVKAREKADLLMAAFNILDVKFTIG